MDWENVLKQARACHTKEAWKQFYETHGQSLMHCHHARPISEIFKCLSRDEQSQNYDPMLWVCLLTGCIASWDLDLGIKIAQSVDKIPYPLLSIRSAEIYLESGQPTLARRVAQRAMRLKTLSSSEATQIQMILCKTYVEEGRQGMALRLLARLTDAIEHAELEAPLKAEILTNMARAHFFLGNYNEAASFFQQSCEIFYSLEYWEAAAKGLFNAAASLHNSGVNQQIQSFQFVEKCYQIALEHDLKGPLSHCYAFYGTHEYQLGQFTQAARYFRRALSAIPQSDQSFRRLHILSMLTLSYLRKGQYRLAFHHGKKTLELAKQDESERFKARYLALESELDWQLGRIEHAQALIQKAVKPFLTQGVQTLEHLSTLSRYYTQSALLNQASQVHQPKIAPRLKENIYSWMEFLIAKSDLFLTAGQYVEAEKLALRCHNEAKQRRSSYFVNRTRVNIIQSRLARQLIDESLFGLIDDLEEACRNTDLDRLHVHVHIARAAIAYRNGGFEECIRHLQSGMRCTGIPHSYKEIISVWLATAEGRAAKINCSWKAQMLTRATRVYFQPSLEKLDHDRYLVSGQYQVSLSNSPILASLMDYLALQETKTASPVDLQLKVWNQSTNSQGWQQKIRNTLMRLRSLFPYCLAPLILHDDIVRLNVEAIRIFDSQSDQKPETVSIEERCLQILQQRGSLSSAELTELLESSAATTKRALKKLIKDDMVSVRKIGRNVQYQADPARFTQGSRLDTIDTKGTSDQSFQL